MNTNQIRARRTIIDLLFFGISADGQEKKLPIYGKLTEYEFLGRIYDLEKIPSIYNEFKNAADEIKYFYATANKDEDWVFKDKRFGLTENDEFENFLKFISECFNPFVRNENSDWKLFLRNINYALHDCEYEIFAYKKIDDKEIFEYREIDKITNKTKLKKGSKIKERHNEYTVDILFKNGGNARLFFVKDCENNDYIMKVIGKDKGVSSEKIIRFENELNFLYTHKHNNIVKVIDYGISEDNQFIYYVMPKYKCDLRYLINEGIEHRKIIKYFWQICEGMKCAHSFKCWHRDLKPENILYDDVDDKLVIADFGIAHFSDEDKINKIVTTEKDKLANFDYHAPEQSKNGLLIESPATDIWAMGLILNEMFTKERAIGEGYKTIFNASRLYGKLDSVVSHMLQTAIEKRCQTIFEVQILFCNAIGDKHKEYYPELMKDMFKNLIYPTSEHLELFVNNDEYRIKFMENFKRYEREGLDKEIYPFYIVFLNEVIKYISSTKSGFLEYYYEVKILTEIIMDDELNLNHKPFIIYLCSKFNDISQLIGKYRGSRCYGEAWDATDYLYDNYNKIPKKNFDCLLDTSNKNGYENFLELLKNLMNYKKITI